MAAAEILIILTKATPLILSFFFNVVTILLSAMVALLPLCISKAKNIPLHINILIKVFSDKNTDANSKKMIALVLVGLSGILPFITFSFIPFTGVPVVGLLTFPIACMLAFLLVCFSYEVVIIPILKSNKVNLKNYHKDIEKFREDYLTVKNRLGPQWDKFVLKTKKVLNNHLNDINKLGKNIDVSLLKLCDNAVESIEPSIQELSIYLNSNTKISLSKEELEIVQEKLENWKKVTYSGALSAGVGAGSAAAANSIFVPATLWNSVIHSLGFGGGTLVSAGAFSFATIYAPIAMGGLAFFMSVKGLSILEKNRISDFLADVIIAALPMIYADNYVNDEELFTVHRLMVNPAINKKDRERIEKALAQPCDLNEIISNHLMYEKSQDKAKIKSRMLLSIAWQLAKADGKINTQERKLHDQMASIFQVEDTYCEEVRALLMPLAA